LAVGLPLILIKTNAIEKGVAGNTAAVRQDVGVIASKVEAFNQSFTLIQDANSSCKQSLQAAGTNALACANSASKIADLLLTEGNRQKAEGDAAKNQPESSQGQWLIDRGNELKQTSVNCTAQANGGVQASP
jgi:hypothetical protein